MRHSSPLRTLPVLGAVILVLSALVGCGSSATPGESPAAVASAASGSTPASHGAGAQISPTTRPPRTGHAGGRILSGLVVRGDDPHCLVLRAGRHRYALVGPWSDRLRAGQQVTVTGDLRVNQAGPCGVPFLVLSVRPR